MYSLTCKEKFFMWENYTSNLYEYFPLSPIKRKLYLRFGDFLKYSMNYHTGHIEKGISVYHAYEFDNSDISIILQTTEPNLLVSLSGCLDRICYEVHGELLHEYGSDREPLLLNPYIIKTIDFLRRGIINLL